MSITLGGISMIVSHHRNIPHWSIQHRPLHARPCYLWKRHFKGLPFILNFTLYKNQLEILNLVVVDNISIIFISIRTTKSVIMPSVFAEIPRLVYHKSRIESRICWQNIALRGRHLQHFKDALTILLFLFILLIFQRMAKRIVWINSDNISSLQDINYYTSTL